MNTKSYKIKNFFNKPEVSVFIGLLVLCTYLSFASPYFFTTINIINVLRQFSLIAILAVGEALVIITGGIDLSVGTTVGFTACFGGFVAESYGANPIVVLIAMLVIGGVVGLTNGLLITKIGLPAFIATLGMMSITQGFALLLTFGVPIHYSETWISVFGGGKVGLFPVSVLVMIGVVTMGIVFAQNTVSGKNVYAVGNNEKAAKLSGIRVGGVKIMVHTITGVLAGICGLILMGQMNGADPFYGKGYELDVIAAAVIGGISMSGGEGNMIGVVVGAALMGVLKNAFVLLAVPGYWQTVAIGLVIIIAVSLDTFRKRVR
jgi:ribose transport system permease protein